MADKKVAIKVETLDRLGESFQESRGITDKLTIEQMIAFAKEPVGSAENKLAKLVDGSITELTAEDLEGATKIKNYAFHYDNNLKGITIPNGVTEIGEYAFCYCRTVTNIILPNTLKKIQNYAFYEARGLIEVIIPDGVTEIGVSAFQHTNIKSINIPNSVTTIGLYAFSDNSYLESVTVGNGLTFNSSVFVYCRRLKNFTTASPIAKSFNFNGAYALTIDSLKNIINALVDYSGTENEGVNTLTLHSTCNATLDAEGATAPDGLTWKEYVAAKGWLLA